MGRDSRRRDARAMLPAMTLVGLTSRAACGAISALLVAAGGATAASQPAAPRYAINIGLQQTYYAGETGDFNVFITVDGQPAVRQPFRLTGVGPLDSISNAPRPPVGGEFRVTDQTGHARVPVRFTKAGPHSVTVAVGHNILESPAGQSITLDVARRWYRDPVRWLEALLAIVALLVTGALLHRRRERTAAPPM